MAAESMAPAEMMKNKLRDMAKKRKGAPMPKMNAGEMMSMCK